jgi:hypothetical protein
MLDHTRVQPSSPISLTDAQMSAVFAASHPLPADRRNAFLEDVARALACLPEIGDGAVHKIIVQIQRKYFDPPLSTHVGHNAARKPSAIEANT